jgi:choline-glycine betaine transporter
MTQPTPDAPRGSVLKGGLVMLVLSFALVWLPLVGTLIAGFVGGRMIRNPVTAVLVALLPGLLLAGVLVALLGAFDLPVLGAVAGVGVFVVVAVQDIPLLLGAYAGAATAR